MPGSAPGKKSFPGGAEEMRGWYRDQDFRALLAPLGLFWVPFGFWLGAKEVPNHQQKKNTLTPTPVF